MVIPMANKNNNTTITIGMMIGAGISLILGILIKDNAGLVSAFCFLMFVLILSVVFGWGKTIIPVVLGTIFGYGFGFFLGLSTAFIIMWMIIFVFIILIARWIFFKR